MSFSGIKMELHSWLQSLIFGVVGADLVLPTSLIVLVLVGLVLCRLSTLDWALCHLSCVLRTQVNTPQVPPTVTTCVALFLCSNEKNYGFQESLDLISRLSIKAGLSLVAWNSATRTSTCSECTLLCLFDRYATKSPLPSSFSSFAFANDLESWFRMLMSCLNCWQLSQFMVRLFTLGGPFFFCGLSSECLNFAHSMLWLSSRRD